MCLGIPGKVIRISNDMAVVDFNGVVVEAATHLVDNLLVGDFVLVHSGIIIEKLDMDEARKTLDLFDELERSMRGAS